MLTGISGRWEFVIMCIDAKERKGILASTSSNILVDASAGTGKTTIMVERALNFIKRPDFKYYQKVAMITFTRFATQQIRDKIVEVDTQGDRRHRIEVNTNNGFVLTEIIRPFLREALGKEYPESEVFKQDFSVNYKFLDWKSGLHQLKEKKVLGSYSDSKKDFTFQLALYILINSPNARKYIKAKFPAMFLDEYQDSGQEMHNFFMYLKDELNISLFIVGDIKQAIYGFRGANPDLFKSLYNRNFTCYQLMHNFRSNLSIISYASYFLGESVARDDIKVGVKIRRHTDWKNYISEEVRTMDNNATTAYLVNSQYHDLIQYLQDFHDFVYMEDPPLGTEYPNHDVLSPLLSFYHDKYYNEFDLLNDLGLQILKKTIDAVKKIKTTIEDGQVEEALNQYSNIVERYLSPEEESNFTLCLEEKWRIQFCKNKPQKQIMTIHKSKGLDFDYIFIDASSFYYRGNFQEENHYVAITRAKKQLTINLDSSQYQKRIKGIEGMNENISGLLYY